MGRGFESHPPSNIKTKPTHGFVLISFLLTFSSFPAIFTVSFLIMKYMLNKVLKRMREEEKKNKKDENNSSSSSYSDFIDPRTAKNSGFHAKKNSQLGAERQRSMGNRNYKTTPKAK